MAEHPIKEIADLNLAALWERVWSSFPSPTEDFGPLTDALAKQYDAMQAAEEARLAAGTKRRRGAKQPKAKK